MLESVLEFTNSTKIKTLGIITCIKAFTDTLPKFNFVILMNTVLKIIDKF